MSEQGEAEESTAPQTSEKDKRIEAIYARVSTRKQLEFLTTQVKSLQAKYPSAIVYRDCASGLNFKRKALQSLLQQVLAGRVRVVHIAYRDRLCRFAYDLLEGIFKHHGTSITVEAHDSLSPESELAEDVLSIITVFSARMYGKRSVGTRRGRNQFIEAKDVSAQRADEGQTAQLQESDVSHERTMV